MNTKAQLGVGGIVMIAIAVIVGLILFTASADNVEIGTRAVTGAIEKANLTVTWGAANNIQYLTGQELVGTPVVTNFTNGDSVVSATNYSVYECVKTTDNLKGICFKTLNDPTKDPLRGVKSNVTYSYYPDGYIDDAGARGVSGIIVLLTAVGIAIVVLAGSKFDF